MATDLRESWLGRHFEKVVVLVAGLIFVASVVLWVVWRDSRAEKREMIRRLIQEIHERQKATIEEVLPEEEQWRLGLKKAPMTVEEFERRLAQLPPEGPSNRDFVWPIRKGSIIEPIVEKVMPPQQILAVEEVQAAVGRGVTPEAVRRPLERMAEQGFSDVAWVSCAGGFNLTLQIQQYADGKAEVQPIVVARVELSRCERKPDGTWSDWELVPVQGAKAVLDKLPRRPENSRDQRSVGLWIAGLDAMQQQVRRLPLVDLVAKDPEGKTIAEVVGEVQGVERATWPTPAAPSGVTAPVLEGAPSPAAAASSTPAAAGPWWRTVTPPTPTAPTATAVPLPMVSQFVYATVWANDLSVRPGRTYQYRMRVAVVNPVYGHSGCEDEQAKWTPELVGEWSEPSAAVTIPRLVHFYFVGVFGDRATMELHRWIHGQWVIVRSVPYRVGTPVICSKPVLIKAPGSGKEVTETVDLSPGVLLVDMIRGFPYTPPGMRPIPTNVLIFSDIEGNLGQRIDWEDQKEANQRRQQRETADQTVGPTAEKEG